jgi:hypothetical protein
MSTFIIGKQYDFLFRKGERPPQRGGELTVIKFKGCPKCHGDLYLSKDMYGKYLTCLQCGYLKDLAAQPEITIPQPVVAEEERKAA